MLQLPSNNDLDEINSHHNSHTVTIYAPHIDPDGATGSSNPNRIQLKNLLAQARKLLEDSGVSAADAKKILRDGDRFLKEHETFWPFKHESLVLFISKDMFRHFTLPPENIDLKVSIGRSFDLGQLEGVIQDNKQFFLLSLSHNNVSLFGGDHYSLKQIELEDMPTNMERALGIDEYPRSLQNRSVESPKGPNRTDKQGEAFHGHYNASETDKNMLLKFFRMIDAKIKPYLQKQDAPLVLAGVEYLIPLYQKANSYPKLAKQHLRGNFEHTKLDDLRLQAVENI